MTGATCPSCQAELEDDLIASTGTAECPFCGTDVTELFPTAQSTTLVGKSHRQAGDASAIEEGLPKSSKVQVVEATDERRVIYIPAGGKRTAFLLGFSLVWLGFMAVFTSVWLFVDDGDAPWAILIPFLGLFWAIGLGMLAFWIKLRFTRTFLSLEPQRLVIQRMLFGRKSVREIVLNADSQAKLVESYQANNVPVYAIEVNGRDSAAKFGTALSREEKDWLVGAFNSFLGVEQQRGSEATFAGSMGGVQSVVEGVAEDVPELDPESGPVDSEIVVEESGPDRLKLELPAVPAGRIRTGLAVGGIIFSLVVLVGGGSTLFGVFDARGGAINWLRLPFFVAFALPAIVPLGLALFAMMGKISIDLSPTALRCRWHVGPFGFGKKLPTGDITEVIVGSGMSVKRRATGRNAAAPSSGTSVKACLVLAGSTILPLTTFHREKVARDMAGLVKHQLRRMGITRQHG